MTPARWQQVKETLASALEFETTEDRASFLSDTRAEDAELSREVEALLDHSPAAFESWAEEGGFLRADSSRNQGRRIGAYRLARELGRGGMGAVWLATRADEEFRKTVAIKLLKRGTDTDEVLRRFRAERAILARLEHPNIARLLDGGTTEDGLPYFVMEYVEGKRLTSYVTDNNLSLTDTLQLFRKICTAVQFAHQNLVVHRDLKPANILVTSEGEPKLLDFGIAKLLESDDEPCEATIVGRERLTPAYASPEQVLADPLTTVSDVYSLGALLYELLTEELPHQFTKAQPSPAELSRVVNQQEVRRPSLVAKKKEVRRRLRGDLDNIVLRAMARQPARRYATPTALAEDLGRYLAGRTVQARPDTLSYRSTKFIRRNKLPVTIGAVFAILLTVGIATTLFEARRAERRFSEVRGLTNSYLFEIHNAIHDLPGATAARQLIVTRALEYLDRLADEARGEATLQLELADAYVKVGDVQGKPYTPNLGDSAGSLRSYTKAAEIATPLAAAEHGTSSTARRILSQACESLGGVQSRLNHWEDATRRHKRAAEIREELLRDDPGHADEWQRGIVADDIGLGDALVNAHRFKEDAGAQRSALEYYRRALPLCEALVATHPDNSADSFLLAKTYSRIATKLSDIGAAEHDSAAYREASVIHRRAVTLDEDLLRTEPTSSARRRNLADELIAFAYLRAFTGEDLPEALADCHRAEKIMASLSAADPANAEAQQDLSSVHFVTGRVLQASGEASAAAQSYERCLNILEPLVAAHPENVETAFDLSRASQGLKQMRERPSMVPNPHL